MRMFRDRIEAGRRLGAALAGVAADAIVFGIPRGGVLVAEPVAAALRAPLDVVVPRKIGAPSNKELAIGAVAPGIVVWDESLIAHLEVSQEYRQAEVDIQEAEMLRRSLAYRGARSAADLTGRVAILVDDGIATGATALAALRWARAKGASAVIVAVPVAPAQTIVRLESEADEVLVLEVPKAFRSVGEFYEIFGQTSDAEVVAALERSAKERG